MRNVKWILQGALALLVVGCPLAMSAETGPSTGTMSLLHVRIVRVSFVQGDVAVKRPSETDWTAAPVNTPLQEGYSVATSANSFAEVEFENGSTARLGQASQIDFSQLALTQQGDKINKLTLSKGYATFHFTPEHHDQYEVDASGVTITVHGKAEFRANYAGDSLRVEVFDGEVQAAHDGKTEQIGKNRILTYDPNAVEAFQTANGLQKDDWDKWTQARDQQAMLATNDESVSLNNSLFGWADLDTYGDWSFFPGYGYGWSPYEPAGWSPYSAGMWGNYPGWGATWISAEPWGWLPYHNGYWNYDASMGWFWSPGSLESWSPSLVNWYQGAGWVGWTPVGSNGGAACNMGVAGCLIAVPPTAIQQGVPIRAGSPLLLRPADLRGATRIGVPTMASTAARPSGAISRPMAAVRVGAPAGVANAAAVHAAPSSVVMGRQVTADSFLGHHGGFLSRTFGDGAQPIHAQMGRTMGGTFPTVVGHNGELAPDSRVRGPQPQGSVSGSGPAFEHRVPAVMAHGATGAGEAASVGQRGGIMPPAASAAANGNAPTAISANAPAGVSAGPSSTAAGASAGGGSAPSAARSSAGAPTSGATSSARR
jgi:hypothetical protein